MQIGQGESLVQFLCPALPNRPHQTVVVVKSGQDGLPQTLYLQKWPKSVFEIVVRVEEEKRSGRALLMVTPMSPLVCRNPAATMPQKQKKVAATNGGRWQLVHKMFTNTHPAFCRKDVRCKVKEKNIGTKPGVDSLSKVERFSEILSGSTKFSRKMSVVN